MVLVNEKIKHLSCSDLRVFLKKLVIGLLHKAKTCTQYNVNAIDRHQVTGRYCTLRNSTPLDQLQSGMGDIFIKLAR